MSRRNTLWGPDRDPRASNRSARVLTVANCPYLTSVSHVAPKWSIVFYIFIKSSPTVIIYNTNSFAAAPCPIAQPDFNLAERYKPTSSIFDLAALKVANRQRTDF